MRRVIELLEPWLIIVLLIAAWEIACRASHTPDYFLPAPSRVAQALVANLPVLIAAAWSTLSVAIVALALARLLAQALATAA